LDYEQRTLTATSRTGAISAMTERHPLDLPDHHCVDDMEKSVGRDGTIPIGIMRSLRSCATSIIVRLHPH